MLQMNLLGRSIHEETGGGAEYSELFPVRGVCRVFGVLLGAVSKLKRINVEPEEVGNWVRAHSCRTIAAILLGQRVRSSLAEDEIR